MPEIHGSQFQRPGDFMSFEKPEKETPFSLQEGRGWLAGVSENLELRIRNAEKRMSTLKVLIRSLESDFFRMSM
jgi:hypothetical protein